MFAPYNLKYPLLKQHATEADLIGTFKDDEGIEHDKVNKWNQIFDFTENEDGKKNQALLSPKNFTLVNYKTIVPDLEIEGNDEFLFELPMQYGGTLDTN